MWDDTAVPIGDGAEGPPVVPRPVALIRGEPLAEAPSDLYIPPDALEVFLETFEGPLDLLLYLIRAQDLDILEVPIAEITEQYMAYVELMRTRRLDLAAEYLVMAATLAEIKSRLLLPRPATEAAAEETDPRAELVRRLLEYERYKRAAESMDRLPRLERDIHPVVVAFPDRRNICPEPTVSLDLVLRAFHDVVRRAARNADHRIQKEVLTVRERMSMILERVTGPDPVPFIALFRPEEGRAGVVVALLAILELVRGALLDLSQPDPPLGPLFVIRKG
jgi:segregation and condensation protein A